MRIAEKTVYSFAELSDSAKETALDWYRQGHLDYEWWDSVYEDFQRICEILGVEIKTGKSSHGLAVYFSGFSHQGQGSCFDAYYRYRKGAHKEIRAYAGQDVGLWQIADDLKNAQKRVFYRYEASIESSSRHMSNRINVTNREDNYADLDDAAESTITEALNDLNHWLFRTLEKEYDYLNSDESVTASIEANELEFTEDGSVF